MMAGVKPAFKRDLLLSLPRQPLESVEQSALAHADPDWLSGLRQGATLSLWLVAAFVALVVVFVFTGGLRESHPGTMKFVGTVFLLVTHALGLWANYRLTRPDPIRPGDAELLTRRAAWSALAAVTGLSLIGYAAATLGAPGVLVGALAWVNNFLWLLGWVCLLLWLRDLASRVGDYTLAERTRTVMWGTAIVFVLAMIVQAVQMSLSTHASGPGRQPQGIACFGGVVGLAGIIFGIWWVMLLVRYRRVFAVAAESARRRRLIG
jgi:uncharacterized membrane protein